MIIHLKSVFRMNLPLRSQTVTVKACRIVFIAGKHHGHLPRLQQDIQRICQAYLDELGSAPFEDYTFMTMVTGSDYGGLEHINSTALVSPRTDLPSTHEGTIPSGDYQRYLGLCSHEYFHAWWVKQYALT